jgi:predicted metal-dependent phosphoesterase TrpH
VTVPGVPGVVPRASTAGRVRVDCHLHTLASGDAITTLGELAEHVHQHSLDVVCITDHNEISAALAAAERDIGARVIVGEEIRTQLGDVIGLYLTARIPYVLPVEEVARMIRAQGGLVYLPHPFDPGRSSIGDGAAGLCEAGLADIIEVFNAKIADQAVNDRAAELAERFCLPGAAGSDAHDPDGIGAAYLEMPDFDGPDSFLAALGQAAITGKFQPHAVRYARPASGVSEGGATLQETPRWGPYAGGTRPSMRGQEPCGKT